MAERPLPRPQQEDLSDGARRIGIELSGAQLESLLRFLRLLERWNQTYNLTAVRDPKMMLTHHVLDCLAVVGPLRREVGTIEGKRLLDVGSGAGLPGLVLAVVEPGLKVTCIDAVGKKAAFVRQAAAELALSNVTSEHGRVERLNAERSFDVIASRAFASLTDFTRLTRPLLAPGGLWMAMKGKFPESEVAALTQASLTFHVEQLSVPGLPADRCIVWLRPLQ